MKEVASGEGEGGAELTVKSGVMGEKDLLGRIISGKVGGVESIRVLFVKDGSGIGKSSSSSSSAVPSAAM